MPGLVSETFTFDGKPVYLPEYLEEQCLAAGEPTDWVGKANSFRVVRGKEPSRGWILLTGLQLDALDLNSTTHYLEIKESGELPSNTKWEKLVIVRADAILPGAEPTVETMYLVEIADRRVYGKMTLSRGSAQNNRGYNIRAIPCFGQEVLTYNDFTIRSLKTGSPPTQWTWAQLFEDLWSGFNLSTFFGPWSDVDIADAVWPAAPPENIANDQTIGWDSFCQVLDHIGHSVVPKQNGKWKIVRVGTEQEGLPDQLELLKNTGRLLRTKHSRVNSEAVIPRYVMVNFPYSSRSPVDAALSGTYPAVATHAWIDNPTFRVLIATANVFGATDPVSTDEQTYATIYDSMTALYDRTATLTSGTFSPDQATNVTQLNARALEIAEAWLRKHYNQYLPKRTHDTYIGNVPNIPSSMLSGLCFYDTGNGLMTDYVFHPYTMDMESNRISTKLEAIHLNPLDNPGPPDIGRPHPPTDLLCPAQIGETGDGVAAWSKETYSAMTGGPALANVNWASSNTQGFNQLRSINSLHDALNLHFVSRQDVLAMFSQDVNKWIAISGNQFHLGEVTQGWRASAGGGFCIDVKAFHVNNLSNFDDPVEVWIGPGRGGAPNVVTGDKVVFAKNGIVPGATGDTDGAFQYICLTEVMDDPVGTVKYMARSSVVPNGWAVMDGTDNASPAGSGLDMTGQVITSDGTDSVSDPADYDPGDYAGTAGADTYNPATLPLFNLVMIERLDNSDP